MEVLKKQMASLPVAAGFAAGAFIVEFTTPAGTKTVEFTKQPLGMVFAHKMPLVVMGIQRKSGTVLYLCTCALEHRSTDFHIFLVLGPKTGSRRAGRGFKRFLEAVGFILAEFEPKRSHGDPVRCQNCGLGEKIQRYNISLSLYIYIFHIYVCIYVSLSQTEICLSQTLSLSQTQLRQLARPKSIKNVTYGVPVAPFGLKLGQNESYGLQEPFLNPSRPSVSPFSAPKLKQI